ncbi:MAG: hypothetical protein ACI8WB_004869 [Phenylobacterium sp.]|jgi:hypothetical protein
MSTVNPLLIGLGGFVAGIIVTSLINVSSPSQVESSAPVASQPSQSPSSSQPALSVAQQPKPQTSKVSQLPQHRIQKDTDIMIARLKQQVAQLQDALANAEQSAKQSQQDVLASQQNARYDGDYNDASANTSANTSNNSSANSPTANDSPAPRPKISEQHAESLLPKPFSTLVGGQEGKTAESFNKFTEEPQDYDWGVMMENQIKDYIAGHQLGNYIEVNSIICKTSICEMRIFERQQETWITVLNQMSDQNWWTFVNVSSSSSSSEEFGNHAYVLASKQR